MRRTSPFDLNGLPEGETSVATALTHALSVGQSTCQTLNRPISLIVRQAGSGLLSSSRGGRGLQLGAKSRYFPGAGPNSMAPAGRK